MADQPKPTNVATIPPRPTRAEMVPLEKVKTAKDLLAHPDMLSRMKAAAPAHINPQRMLRIFALAMGKTPEIAQADLRSLVGCMMVCASLGLEPNTPLGHAYLIPFKKRGKNPQTGKWETVGVDLQLIIGYRGFIDLARRSGSMVSIHADVVYEGDDFDFEYGTDMHLRHRPIGNRENRQPVWAYAVAKLTDGFAFEVLPYVEVLRTRNKSQGYQQALRNRDDGDRGKRAFESSPWVAYEHEMAAKTMIRRLSKSLPMSIDFANAAHLDAMSDEGRQNLSALADMSGDALQEGIEGAITDRTGEDEVIDGTIHDDGGDRAPAQPQQTQSHAAPTAAQAEAAAANPPAPAPSPPAAAAAEAPPAAQPEGSIPVSALIGGVKASRDQAELDAFWRDCEEARSMLNPGERADLNLAKAEVERDLRQAAKGRR